MEEAAVPKAMDPRGVNSLTDFRITAASAQGGRKYMEDRLHIEVVRNPEGGELEFIFAAVYDGHGGPQASEYVRRHLFNNIVSNQEFYSDDDQLVLSAIRSGFLRTHTNMQREAENWPPTTSGFPCTAGTTATCAFIRKGKLFTGHVGDSSIILANFSEDEAGYDDAKLTDDHKPEIKTERQRIERVGGAVGTKSGIVRVIWKRPLRGHQGPVRRSTATENIPFLAVARSLGDFWSLNPSNNEYVVSPEPDIDVFELKDTDNFLVISTDGLTNVVGIRAIIQVLKEAKKIGNSEKIAGNQRMIQDINAIDKDLPLNHAHCLLQHAFKKWGSLRADNISIICIELNSKHDPKLDRAVISLNNPEMDVCHELTEYPMGMVRVNDECSQVLRTNQLRHCYFGTLDKGVTFPQGRSATDNVTNRRHSTRKQQHQQLQFPEYSKGPGFIYPEMPNESVNNNNIVNSANLDNTSSRHFLNNNNNNNVSMTYESDVEVEEPRKNTAILPNPCQNSREEEEDQWEVKWPTKAARQGLKRRLVLDENNGDDGYERYIPEENGEQGGGGGGAEEPEGGLKPPPAKRSRIQSVVSFFSNLFSFRWAI